MAKKTVIGVNTLSAMAQPIYANHIQTMCNLKSGNPEDTFAFFTPIRASIDRMRNECCNFALEYEFDYIIFIDDDVMPPVNIDWYKRFKAADKDIIGGWTVIRGYPFNNMMFRFNENKTHLGYYNDFKKEDLEENDLLKCDAIGCSLMMLKVDLLKKMPAPFFMTGPYHTEDIYFCMKARDFYPETSIYTDVAVKTWHMLNPQFVNADNREHLKAFEETLNPDLKEDQEIDRGDKYLYKVTGLFN